MLSEPAEGYRLLADLGATPRLIRHARLVAGAAGELIFIVQSHGISLTTQTVQLGAILHDAGKIEHPEELVIPGALHELAGEALLLAHGVPSDVARCCATHGSWHVPGVSLEERMVALADKLWKGKRESDLELSVIDEVAFRLGRERWDVFDSLDTAFEEIASRAFERLERSRLDQDLSDL